MTTRAAMRRFVAATQDRPSSGAVISAPGLGHDAADNILAAFGLDRDAKR